MPFWSSKSSSRPQDPNPSKQELVFRANFPPSTGYNTAYATDSHPDYEQGLFQQEQVSPTRQGFVQEPTFNLVAPENSPTEQIAFQDQSQGPYYRSPPPSPGFPSEESSQKKSLRNKLGIHSSTHVKDELPEPKKLQRRSSLRQGRKDPQSLHYAPLSTTIQQQQQQQQSNQWPATNSQQYPLPSTSEEDEDRSTQLLSLQDDQVSSHTSVSESLQPPGSSSSNYPGSIQPSPKTSTFPAHLQVYTNTQPNEAGISPHSQNIISPGWPPRSPYPQESNPGSRPSSRQQLVHPSDPLSRNSEVDSQISNDSNPAEPAESMAPSSGSRQTRYNQSADISKQSNPVLSREGSNLQYQRGEQESSQQQLASASNPRPAPIASPPAIRAGQVAQIAAQGDLGRDTTPPLRSGNDMSEQDMLQLQKDYKELREKYSKVKKYYFEKDAQVQQLQNVLAHQRLSQSRTSLDDSEYVARLHRLDGLIAQLAFSIRKDWKTVPGWLQPYVNKEAVTTGKQEMTAVGRAFISKWLADEVFDKYFHPCLEPLFSMELKTLQKNLRRLAPQFQSGEEEEALLAKTINWRLATVDGLQSKLTSVVANGRRKQLIDNLNEQLAKDLKDLMSDPSPAGLEGGVHMIVEVAIGILANLPLESRDVNIEYFMPGQIFQPEMMKNESGIPPLSNPVAAAESGDVENTSRQSSFSDPKEDRPDISEEMTENSNQQEHGKKGFLGGMLSNNKKPASGVTAQDDSTQKVRICAFMALQIRGKTVLSKAPVFSS